MFTYKAEVVTIYAQNILKKKPLCFLCFQNIVPLLAILKQQPKLIRGTLAELITAFTVTVFHV